LETVERQLQEAIDDAERQTHQLNVR